ncbi:grpE protein homolog, mitochondrial [Bradysia coprophila]|uniref:grpE protein homolog, mitochondrial n=1 Tax=Bradysia coprophila TaxID=38358 RepID=UPI00187D9A06|nr:grpE protein homolog, mitochondrial [Bradysia coprophila]
MASLTVMFRSPRFTTLLQQTSNLRLSAPLSSRNFSSERKENVIDPEQKDSESKPTAEVEGLTLEVTKLKEKNDELLDKYKRSLADSENLRKRLTKQIDDAKVFGIQSFCKDLLEVADILGHATNAVPKDEVNNSNPHLKNLYEGLTMTQQSLMQVFKRHGLEVVNPINEKFNPNLHEALFQKQCENVDPDVVVEVTKVGYKLRERCIRPALVGVSKK